MNECRFIGSREPMKQTPFYAALSGPTYAGACGVYYKRARSEEQDLWPFVDLGATEKRRRLPFVRSPSVFPIVSGVSDNFASL